MTASGTALLLTGGHSHPAELSLAALTDVIDRAGLEAMVSEDPEQGFLGLAESDHALVIVNALRFTMTHPRYEEFRDEWAFSLSATARNELTDWVRAGRPLLALHTALVSFDDWPGWGDLIGGSWDWERSHHPPIGPVDVRCEPGHAVTAGLGSFTLSDEIYVDLDLRPGNEIVATSSVDAGSRQPACWTRQVDGSRVATSALGHDLQSLDQAEHRDLLGRLVSWLLDEPPTKQEARTP